MAQLVVAQLVVAQLVEQSLPISEIHGSNPIIVKFYFINYYNMYGKDKCSEKEAGNGPFKNIIECFWQWANELLYLLPPLCKSNDLLGNLFYFTPSRFCVLAAASIPESGYKIQNKNENQSHSIDNPRSAPLRPRPRHSTFSAASNFRLLRM